MIVLFNRRSFFKNVVACIAVTTMTVNPLIAEKLLSDTRPNILWICTDQQRFDTVESLGNPHIKTPNLNKLVDAGVAFTHAYCQSPTCTPSRASFLTGKYPDRIRACMNDNVKWADAAPLITKTLANAGYYCGLAGKLHLSTPKKSEDRPENGYHVFDIVHEPETPWCFGKAEEFIRMKQNGPWLFSLNAFDPHSKEGEFILPFMSSSVVEKYLERFIIKSMPGPYFQDSDLEAQKRLEEVYFQSNNNKTQPIKYEMEDAQLYQAQYWSLIEQIDDYVGRLVKALDETGQLDNTIIIFTSDHGESLGDHGFRRKGCRFYEGLVRVPLIISWPNRFKKGIKSDALVELTDIVPTIMEACNIQVPNDLDGKTLMPILESNANPNEHREFVRSIYYNALGDGSYGTMIRTRDFKLVTYHGTGLGELYDMNKDPHEFNNLWDISEYNNIRFKLLCTAFDEAAFATDLGPKRLNE